MSALDKLLPIWRMHLDLKKWSKILKQHKSCQVLRQKQHSQISKDSFRKYFFAFPNWPLLACSEIMAKISEMRTGSGSAKEMSIEERAKTLNQLFTERIVPLLNEINKEAVHSEAEAQLLYWQTGELTNRAHKADVMK